MAIYPSKMNTSIIIQARMGSTRLPGKTLKEILGKPMISYQLERLKRCRLVDSIIVATTNHPLDRMIIDYCKNNQILFFVGNENNVLQRYYQAAKEYNVDLIVRVTADCPLIDPELIDSMIDLYLKYKGQYEYVSNVIERSFPRGLDAEILSFTCLEKITRYAITEEELEHVTLYLLDHPDRFNLYSFKQKQDDSSYRWTVDTEEDFNLIKFIIEHLYPQNSDFTTTDILNLYKKFPKLKEMNIHIKQKLIPNTHR